MSLGGLVKAGGPEAFVRREAKKMATAVAEGERILWLGSRVELFDRHNVSFVSVTQLTTTSMGRLTLNVLLSFDGESLGVGERLEQPALLRHLSP